MLVTAMVTAVEAQPRAISIIESAYATAPASAPPSDAGTFTPIMPSSARPRSSPPREALLVVDLGGDRQEAALGVVAGRLLNELLGVGEREVHGGLPLTRVRRELGPND